MSKDTIPPPTTEPTPFAVTVNETHATGYEMRATTYTMVQLRDTFGPNDLVTALLDEIDRLRALRSPSPLPGAALGGPDVEPSETCETSDAQLDQYVALLDEILGMNSRFTEVKRLRDFVRSLRRPSDLTRAEPQVAPLPKEAVALGAQMVEALEQIRDFDRNCSFGAQEDGMRRIARAALARGGR